MHVLRYCGNQHVTKIDRHVKPCEQLVRVFEGGASIPGVPNRGYEIEHQGVRKSLGHRAAYISLIEQYISQNFLGVLGML